MRGDTILFDAWPVDARGVAESPSDGPMTLDELEARIAAAPSATS